MCDVFGGHATLEESVTNLVTARLVLEADGEVVLAIMREVEFHTFLSGDAQVNIPLAQQNDQHNNMCDQCNRRINNRNLKPVDSL